ncbi:uncharacterized protein LOC133178473 [Saccostrea echinata]|uniref:uncharacterized protein LOC133178473 n=1 Tax=Saccostrea echinata TaxID=191078 RepID=UPI002A839EC6|nr:uncharacterized protein LOC133178473 [Saccostrea echinata]
MAELNPFLPKVSWREEANAIVEVGFSLKYNDFSDLFKIISVNQRNEIQTRTKARIVTSNFEREERDYFQLFKPSQYEVSRGDSAFTAFDRDLKNLKDFSFSPSLREVYAAADILQKAICLITLQKGTTEFRGIDIHPFLHKGEEDLKTIVIVLKFFEGGVYFQEVNWPEDRPLETSPFTIINKNHEKCLDRRFCNSFDVLKDGFNFNFLCSDTNVTNDDGLTIFEVLGDVFYADKAANFFVRELVGVHQLYPLHKDVYARLMEKKMNVYIKEEDIKRANDEKDPKKRGKLQEKNRTNAQEKHLKEWKILGEGDSFAVASLYHIELYVSDGSRHDMFHPICTSVIAVFKSSLFVQRAKGLNLIGKYYGVSCQSKKPEVIGNFPLISGKKEEFIFNQLKKTAYICCPPEGRGHTSAHRHLKHIKESKTRLDEIQPFPTIRTKLQVAISVSLEMEGRRIDHIENGTLEQCLSKEIFGSQSQECIERLREVIPGISTDNDPEKRLETASKAINIPIYVLRFKDREKCWKRYVPSNVETSDRQQCTFYITFLQVDMDDYIWFERIVPIKGCNCSIFSPEVANLRKEDQSYTETLCIAHEQRHTPLVTFLTEDPEMILFTHEERQYPLFTRFSETRSILDRPDMKDRMIDANDDSFYSLYRCISKEIFGTENHYELIRNEVLLEILNNPAIYAKFLRDERQSKHKEEMDEFLDNFRFRKHSFLDKIIPRSVLERNEVLFFSNRIEDGLELEDLELFATATCFQCSIYVVSIVKKETEIEEFSGWRKIEKLRVKTKPLGLENRIFQSQCQNTVEHYVTLFKTCAGIYQRIAGNKESIVCNCLQEPPVVPSMIKRDDSIKRKDFDIGIIRVYQGIESQLYRTQQRFEFWMRCNIIFEKFCTDSINLLEGRRKKSNIASITGSSIGLIGGALAAAGIFASPVTAGASLGLVVAGGVVSGLGSVASVISKLTELGLNKKESNLYKRLQMNMREHSRRLENETQNLEEVMMKLDEIIKSKTGIANKLSRADPVRSSAIYLRSVSGIASLPIAVLRALSRAIVAAEAFFIPASVLLDGVILVLSARNLYKGSITGKSKELRTMRNFLKLTRIQMVIWAFGNDARQYIYECEDAD